MSVYILEAKKSQLKVQEYKHKVNSNTMLGHDRPYD